MAETASYRGHWLGRGGRRLLALVFALLGTGLALVVAVVALLNVAPARQWLMETALAAANTGETFVEIGEIGGTWPGELRLGGLRIGDSEGVWLTLESAALDWRPLALWRGELHVTRLEIAGLDVARAPAGGEDEAEESGFALPSLPFGLRLDGFQIREARLGKALAGDNVTFSAGGDARLSGDVTQFALRAERTDGTPGEIDAALLFLKGPERGRLTLRVVDGAPGRAGLAGRLLGEPDIDHLTLTAEGQSLAGLMTGVATLDAGAAAQARIDAHGAFSERLNLTIAGEASGRLVARELADIGSPERLRFSAKLAEGDDHSYALNAVTAEAGALRLTGAGRATPLTAERWGVEAEGRIAGLDRLLDLDDAAFLGDAGWRLRGDTDSGFTEAHIEEAAVTTAAGELRFRGAASFGDGFSLAGDGEAAIADLAPVGEMLGQTMRGTATAALTDFTLEDGTGGGDIVLTAGRIETDDAALDRLLADGIEGEARFALGQGGAVSLSDIDVTAGDGFALEGEAALGADGRVTGDATLTMRDIGDLLAEAGTHGATTAHLRIEGPPDAVNISAEAELSDGAIGGFDARRATLTAALADGSGPVSFRLEGADGNARLDMQATLPAEGGARFDAIRANLFGATLTGDIAVSPDGLASGRLDGKRVAMQPLGALVGLAMEGRADIELDLSAEGGRQDARALLTARRLDIQLTEGMTLDRVEARVALTDLTGEARIDATAEAESGATGNTHFTTMKAAAAGPLDRIEISATLRGERLTLTAEPAALDLGATYRPEAITVAVLTAQIGGHSAALAEPLTVETGAGLTRVNDLAMDFAGPEGKGRLTGALTLRPRAAVLALDMANLPLELTAPFLPADPAGGTLSGTVRLDTGREEGTVSLSIAQVRLAEAKADIRPAFDATLEAGWAKRRLTLSARASGVSEEPFLLKASLPLIRDPQGAWPMLPERGPVEGSLSWRGPMASLMALFDLPGQRLTGDTEIALTAAGDISAPLMSGRVHIRNGTFENFETGTAMRDLDVSIEAERSEMLRFRMSARDSGKGRVTAEGTLSLAADANPAADVRTRFDKMQVVRRQDLVLAVDGDLALTGAALPPSLDEPLLLSGELTTTTARFHVPEKLPGGVAHIDVIEVQGPGEADTVEDPEEAPPLPLELDVTLAIGTPPARVTGRGIDSLWTGSVTMTGLAEDPNVSGQLVSERGTLDFAGKTFVLSRGRVIFAGEKPIDPLLDIALDYARSDFEATVAVTGRGSSPKIGLSSNPSLPRDEIISRILFEKGVGELSAFEAAQLANTAAELSGGGGIGGFGILGEIQNTFGLDVLRVDQGASGGTTLSAGKYLREGVYVGVEQGALASDSGVKVEIDITDNISVDTKIGNDASSDVGVNWKWDY
ncbi:MAG: translocation/assembly module TamB [Parvibaculum sp.]